MQSHSPREQKPSFLEKLIGSAFKENSPELIETELQENVFKIPSVENIPKTSLKRRLLNKLDLNKIEPKAKTIQLGENEKQAGPSNIKKRKYTTKSCKINILTINLKDCVKQPASNDVYDFNLEMNQEISSTTPSSHLPHSDFHSPVKLTANKNASFSYRAAAKQSKSQNISQSEKLFDELIDSSNDAQQFSQNEEMLEDNSSVVNNILAETEVDENISVKESVNFKTPKITLKNKRFKKYSPL